jgi:hypothetical protein
MTQIGFDFETPLGGVVSANDHCTNVGGPCAGYILPPMMVRKFVGETAAKVVRLSDIYRIPPSVGGKVAEDIHSANGVKGNLAELKVFELVRFPADSVPSEGRFGG